MGWNTHKFLGVFVLLIFINGSLACQGLKLKIHYIKSCSSNNVIKLSENATVKLTKDCEMIPVGCAETDGFKTAMVHYEVYKNNLPVLRGDVDACQEVAKAKAEVKDILSMFGIPDHCPMAKMTKCEDGTRGAKMEKFKSLLGLALGGPIRTEVTIQHDNGKSCFKSEVEFVKKG